MQYSVTFILTATPPEAEIVIADKGHQVTRERLQLSGSTALFAEAIETKAKQMMADYQKVQDEGKAREEELKVVEDANKTDLADLMVMFAKPKEVSQKEIDVLK